MICLGSGHFVHAESSWPKTVFLKTDHESFNPVYDIVLRAQLPGYPHPQIWVKDKSQPAPNWIPVAMPKTEKEIIMISADDENILAIDEDRQMFTMKNGLSHDPSDFKWTKNWGAPFWAGSGMKLPEDTLSFSLSLLSRTLDQYHLTPIDEIREIGVGCTTNYVLKKSQVNITLLDPWLPSDQSYEVCGPRVIQGDTQKWIKLRQISASGSRIAVISEAGKVYTRIYDFDISGGDDAFVLYTWDVEEPHHRLGRFGPRKLPVEDWFEHPSLPEGQVSDLISLHKEGIGGKQGELRIEGIGTDSLQQKSGSGYYFKKLQDRSAAWQFHYTGDDIKGKWIQPPASLEDGLATQAEFAYLKNSKFTGVLPFITFSKTLGKVEGFHPYCSPARLTFSFDDGSELKLKLHHIQGIRQEARNQGLPGLSDEAMNLNGAIEYEEGPSILGHAQQFAKLFLRNRPFTPVKIDATLSGLKIKRDFTKLDPTGFYFELTVDR